MFSRVLITAQVCKIELSCYFIIMLPQINLERMTRCKICSLRTVYSTIVWSRYVFSSQNGEFTATNSNAFILKTKYFVGIFSCIFRIYRKFITCLKKVQANTLSFSGIIDSGKGEYLNAQQVLFAKILRQSTC